MISKYLRCLGVILILAILIAPIDAAQRKVEKKEKAPPVSLVNGDQPPGNAMSLSMDAALAQLRDSMSRSFVGEMKCCVLGSCITWDVQESTMNITPADFSYSHPYVYNHKSNQTTNIIGNFKSEPGYLGVFHPLCVHCNGVNCYSVSHSHLPKGTPENFIFGGTGIDWTDEATAQKFADAYNRLVYGARRGEQATLAPDTSPPAASNQPTVRSH